MTRAACTKSVRKYPLPRLVMRPRMVRSPVDICLGTSPIHAEKSRPLANAAPLPIAATIALEMIGPMPGTVITLRQPSSLFAKVSISSVTGSIRSSSCRQSLARSATMRSWRATKCTSIGWHSVTPPCCSAPRRPLQIQLLIGLGWNKACVRALYGLLKPGDRMGSAAARDWRTGSRRRSCRWKRGLARPNSTPLRTRD